MCFSEFPIPSKLVVKSLQSKNDLISARKIDASRTALIINTGTESASTFPLNLNGLFELSWHHPGQNEFYYSHV